MFELKSCDTGTRYAGKIVPLAPLFAKKGKDGKPSKVLFDKLMNEIKIQRSLHHPNVVHCMRHFSGNITLAITKVIHRVKY